MRDWFISALLLALGCVVPIPDAAAKNCKKGIPCGNSCIAANKVCRIGTSAVRSSPPAAASGFAPSPSRGSTYSAATSNANAATPTSEPWVGSLSDGVFFRTGCSAARDLAPNNRRYFESESHAISAGFRRSGVPGC